MRWELNFGNTWYMIFSLHRRAVAQAVWVKTWSNSRGMRDAHCAAATSFSPIVSLLYRSTDAP